MLVEFAAAPADHPARDAQGAAHDQQVIVLALLHLIAGTVLGGGLGYGLCFLGVLVVAPGALVLSHLRREVEGNYRQGARDRTGLPVDVPRILRSRRVVGRSFLAVTCLLSVPIFVFTAVLFVIFPRVGLSLLLLEPRPHAARMIGFSGKRRPRRGRRAAQRPQARDARRDPRAPGAAAAAPHPAPERHRARRVRRPHLGARARPSSAPPRATERAPGPDRAVPGPGGRPGDAHRSRADRSARRSSCRRTRRGLRLTRRGQLGVERDATALPRAGGELRYRSPRTIAGLLYDVFLSRKRAPTFQRLPAAERARYLELPSDLPSRIIELAAARGRRASIDPCETRRGRSRTHLRTEYRVRPRRRRRARTQQPLDHFLFESKRGHCEFYSTAMAVLLRAVDVPTRNVTGFVGGTYNRFGRFYAVRQGDAHSWVEVYLDGEGGSTFDPTPPADAAPKSELVGAWAYLRDLHRGARASAGTATSSATT